MNAIKLLKNITRLKIIVLILSVGHFYILIKASINWFYIDVFFLETFFGAVNFVQKCYLAIL